MRLPLPPQSAALKRFLPRALLSRTLLIMLIPLVVVQAVALQLFYGPHMAVISRRLSTGVAADIGTTIGLLNRLPGPDNQAWILRNAWDQFELGMSIEPGGGLARRTRRPWYSPDWIWPRNNALGGAMSEKVGLPYTVDWESDPTSIVLDVAMADAVLHVNVPRKRLYSGTMYIFVPWLVGSSLLLFVVAAIILRNQVRAIRRLAAAAEAFGIGRDVGPIKPEGATEVRQAAAAFNRMQERIRRFLQQRTEMLAGVSHDLRTPLTRLRLALAVMPDDPRIRDDIAEMTGDVEEMERMIAAYLAFARGEGTEQAKPTDLGAVLREVAAGARRSGRDVALDMQGELTLPLRADAVRRAVANLVENACRHARHVAMAATRGDRTVLVTVDDDGPGIPAGQREDVFRPFETGTAGGTGLGLSIARDIFRAHGGDVVLEDSPLGGLRARIRLPV